MMNISREILAAARDLVEASRSQLVTADEMERYCSACAGQIRSGEMEMTWGELRNMLADTGDVKTSSESDDPIAERIARRWKAV